MKVIESKIEDLKRSRRLNPKISKRIQRQINLLKEVDNEMERQQLININDLNHWCSYNGIINENKIELFSMIGLKIDAL